MNRPKIRTAVFTSALALGLAANAGAAQLVTFTRGHSIVVQAAEKRGNWFYFTLEGGGEMGVPVKQVARMEEYDLPLASAAPQAPGSPEPQRVPAAPNAPPGAPATPAAMEGNPGSQPPQDGNAVDPSAAEQPQPLDAAGAVLPNGEEWRTRVKKNVGMGQQLGTRRAGGMGGANRQQGMPGPNPYNRRPPNKPPQQPDPPQQ